MEGFVKWQRSCLDNDIWRHDQTAWHVFEYFWGVVDFRTGKTNKAYRTIAEFLDIPLSTLHGAIERLIEAKMIRANASPNGQYTTFSIVNWSKHQGYTEHFTGKQPNANRTPTEHIIRIKELKNKEINKESFKKTQNCEIPKDYQNLRSLDDIKTMLSSKMGAA